jgi:hypothetical protein
MLISLRYPFKLLSGFIVNSINPWGLQFAVLVAQPWEYDRKRATWRFILINMWFVALTAPYVQRRRRFRRASTPSSTTLSLLGKELHEAHLQALLGSGMSHVGSLSINATDPLLSNLGYSLPISEGEDPIKPSVTIEIPSKPMTSIHQQSPRLTLSLLCLNLMWGLVLQNLMHFLLLDPLYSVPLYFWETTSNAGRVQKHRNKTPCQSYSTSVILLQIYQCCSSESSLVFSSSEITLCSFKTLVNFFNRNLLKCSHGR